MTDSRDPVRLGHWTDPSGATGCTVVLFPEGCVASGEIRGGAPATREFGLLDPRRMVEHIDAVVLTGGSAFGLAAADGVVAALAERGRGFATRAGNVPIVVAMGLFDLAEGVPKPGADQGRLALEVAAPQGLDGWASGAVGAGAGATVGKWRGPKYRRPGGLGMHTVRSATGQGDLWVTAVVAVNAVGDIDDGTVAAEVLTGEHVPPKAPEDLGENTTIGVVWTNAIMDKVGARQVAESGHDGFARAIIPAHTSGDGDALVAVSTGEIEAPIATVRLLTTVAVETAIRHCRPVTSNAE